MYLDIYIYKYICIYIYIYTYWVEERPTGRTKQQTVAREGAKARTSQQPKIVPSVEILKAHGKGGYKRYRSGSSVHSGKWNKKGGRKWSKEGQVNEEE